MQLHFVRIRFPTIQFDQHRNVPGAGRFHTRFARHIGRVAGEGGHEYCVCLPKRNTTVRKVGDQLLATAQRQPSNDGNDENPIFVNANLVSDDALSTNLSLFVIICQCCDLNEPISHGRSTQTELFQNFTKEAASSGVYLFRISHSFRAFRFENLLLINFSFSLE